MSSYSQTIIAMDVSGNYYSSIESIPDGTEFKHLNLSYTDFDKLPEKIATLKVGTLVVENCPNLYNFENAPQGLQEVYCSRSSIKTFEGIPESVRYVDCSYTPVTTFEHLPKKGLEKVVCHCCNKIEYISDDTPSEIIEGISKSRITKCKARLISEYMSVVPKTRLTKPLSGKTKFVSKHVPLTPKFPYVNPCSDNEHTH